MKTIIALFLACFTTALFGQAPPILRNTWDTNMVPVNGVVSNSLSVTGAATATLRMGLPIGNGSMLTDYIFGPAGLVWENGVNSNQVTWLSAYTSVPMTLNHLGLEVVGKITTSNNSGGLFQILTGDPEGAGNINFYNNGHSATVNAGTNSLSIYSEYGNIFNAVANAGLVEYGGGPYQTHEFQGALSVQGASPGQLYLLGTNNGALGFTLNSNAVTTNIFLFDLRSVLAGQVIFAHSTNTIGTTNFIVMTNGWASNAFSGFILSGGGGGSNNNLYGLSATYATGTTNPPFRVNNSNGTAVVFVSTNGNVGIWTATPVSVLDVPGTSTFGSVTATNGVAYQNKTLSGVGGANTNFTGQATDGTVYIDGGTTNVNFVAIMPGTSGLTYNPTYIISNLTATTRQFSFSSVTNRLQNLQQYDGVALPFTITNKHTAILSTLITSSNVMYALKQCTNGF